MPEPCAGLLTGAQSAGKNRKSLALGKVTMGVFTIYSDCDTDATVISNLFIDQYMKDAGEIEIKVYLYLVRMMGAGRAASIADMASSFHQTEKDILRAIRYWQERGLIALQFDGAGNIISLRFCELTPRRSVAGSSEVADNIIPIEPMLGAKAGEEPDSVKAKKAESARAASAADAAAREDMDDEERAQLLMIVEQYIGKPLAPREVRVINYIADELHFSADLIDYLVQYCVGMNKKDFRYIEKVAVNWASEGISTTVQAQHAVAQGSPRVKKNSASRSAKTNAFNRFQQNHYDYDEFERQLLEN